MKRAFAIDESKCLFTEERDGECFVGSVDLSFYRSVRPRITPSNDDRSFLAVAIAGVFVACVSGFLAGYLLACAQHGRLIWPIW